MLASARLAHLATSDQVGGVVIGLLALFATYRTWHGKTINPLNTPEAERALSFILAAFPALTACWWSAMLGLFATDIDHPNNQYIHGTVVAVVLITALAAVASFVLAVSVMGFRRPKWVIPPPLR